MKFQMDLFTLDRNFDQHLFSVPTGRTVEQIIRIV